MDNAEQVSEPLKKYNQTTKNLKTRTQVFLFHVIGQRAVDDHWLAFLIRSFVTGQWILPDFLILVFILFETPRGRQKKKIR